MQNVAVSGGPQWVVDTKLANPPGGGTVASWAIGPVFIDGKLNSSTYGPLPLPSDPLPGSHDAACEGGRRCGGRFVVAVPVCGWLLSSLLIVQCG